MSETKGERLDRELIELVQELRILLPGVQVLFAFLLTVPFTQVFTRATDAQRLVYFLAFASTAVSAVLLIAPGVRHRARFRDRDKEALIESGNRLALGGTAFLAIAMTLVAVLVTEHLYGWIWGVIAGIVVSALAVWFWYAWAFQRQMEESHRS